MGVMEKIKAAFCRQATSVDPKAFNSKLAMQTEWTPLEKSAANFCTHRVQNNLNDGSMLFVGTGITRMLPVLFAALPVIVVAVLFSGAVPPFSQAVNEMPLLYALLPLDLLAGVGFGIFLYKRMNVYRVFDTQLGAFYRSKTNPRKIADVTSLDSYVPFKEIGALQILEKYVQQSGKNNSSYMAYELNIVRKDGRRTHIISHGAYKKLAEDAQQIAMVLNIPVWDVMEQAQS